MARRLNTQVWTQTTDRNPAENGAQGINMATDGDDCMTATAVNAAAIATFAYIRPLRRLPADVDFSLSCEREIDAAKMGWQKLRVGKNLRLARIDRMSA